MIKAKEEYKEIICSVPNTNCRFKYIAADKGIQISLKNSDTHNLIFALEGKLKITCSAVAPHLLAAGRFTLLPENEEYCVTSMQPGLYALFSFNQIDHVWTSTKIRKLLEASSDERCRNTVSLPIRHPIDSFLRLITLYMEEKTLDRTFYAGKDSELLSLLYAFYTPDELGRMFHPILSADLNFRSFVEANYLKVETASQLAELANCSLVTLNRKFRQYFNETAYQWIIKNKTILIKKRLQNTNGPLSELAKEFGFYSGSELNRFCQRQFGTSALKLRKQISVRGRDKIKK